jgi:transposase
MSCQELVEENIALKAKIAQQQQQYAALRAQFDQLIKLPQGFKSEKLCRDPEIADQPTLLEVESQPEQEVAGLLKIGEEITDTLEYTPASLVVRRTICPKYAQVDGNGVIIGNLPTRPIDKAIAVACLLAYILVCKYVDHLLLYRQIQRFNREYGWNPSQSTLCTWVDSCCKLLEPLYNKLKQKILESDYIPADESPIKVLDKDKPKDSHQGYQWVYHAPLQHLVLFNYRKGIGMLGPEETLDSFQGYLQCDGYKVYDKIAQQQQGITAVRCLVHARRKFFDAQDNDANRAKYALEMFRKIYQLDLRRLN